MMRRGWTETGESMVGRVGSRTEVSVQPRRIITPRPLSAGLKMKAPDGDAHQQTYAHHKTEHT